MEVDTNVDQNIEKTNDDKKNTEEQNGDSIYKTFDREYIRNYGRGTLFDLNVHSFTFDERYKLPVDELMKETNRKSFAEKFRKSAALELLFEELTSVFWVIPTKSQLQKMAWTFEGSHLELCRHYGKLPYDNTHVNLSDLVQEELYARYIRHIGTLSSAEKPNWLIKPSMNRKLYAKIRNEDN